MYTCAENTFYRQTIPYTPIELYTPYKLRNNIIQLDLAYRKPQGYNLTLNHKNVYTIINQP